MRRLNGSGQTEKVNNKRYVQEWRRLQGLDKRVSKWGFKRQWQKVKMGFHQNGMIKRKESKIGQLKEQLTWESKRCRKNVNQQV